MGAGDNATHMNKECIDNDYAAEMVEGSVPTLCVRNRSYLPRQTRTAANTEIKYKEDERTARDTNLGVYAHNEPWYANADDLVHSNQRPMRNAQ